MRGARKGPLFWVLIGAALLLQACTVPGTGLASGVPSTVAAVPNAGMTAPEETGWATPVMAGARSTQALASEVRSVRVSVSALNGPFRVVRRAVRNGLNRGKWQFDCLALPTGRHVIRVEAFLDAEETRPCGQSESEAFEIHRGQVSTVSMPALRLDTARTGSWRLKVEEGQESRGAVTRYDAWITLTDGRTIATASARPMQTLEFLPVGVQKIRYRATAQRRGRTFTHTVAETAVIRAGATVETVLRFFPRGLEDEEHEEGDEDQENEEEEADED